MKNKMILTITIRTNIKMHTNIKITIKIINNIQTITSMLLFIDNYADSKGVLLEFKGYFGDKNMLKCWHNYGYDRHVMLNTGIECQGFGGDTMHMARLADASRMPN